MPDLYTAVPGGMPTGWLKKISLLEKQVSELQRDISEIKQAMKRLEDAPDLTPMYSNQQGFGCSKEEAMAPPVKRGPGRPRKNPQA